jgi:hypothetical protein
MPVVKPLLMMPLSLPSPPRSEPRTVTLPSLAKLPLTVKILPEFGPDPPCTSPPIVTGPMSPALLISPLLTAFEPPMSEPPRVTLINLPWLPIRPDKLPDPPFTS